MAAPGTTGKLHWLRDPQGEPGVGEDSESCDRAALDGLEREEGAKCTLTVDVGLTFFLFTDEEWSPGGSGEEQHALAVVSATPAKPSSCAAYP